MPGTNKKSPKEMQSGIVPAFLTDVYKRIISSAQTHPLIQNVGAAVLVLTLGLIVAWFVCLSGLNEPAGLIYAGF